MAQKTTKYSKNEEILKSAKKNNSFAKGIVRQNNKIIKFSWSLLLLQGI